MLTVDIYFLLSNQSARKVLFTCLANTKYIYYFFLKNLPASYTSDDQRKS